MELFTIWSHISTSDKTFELFTSQCWQKPAPLAGDHPRFHIISSCYIPLLSKIKQPDMFPRNTFNNTVLTKQSNKTN